MKKIHWPWSFLASMGKRIKRKFNQIREKGYIGVTVFSSQWQVESSTSIYNRRNSLLCSSLLDSSNICKVIDMKNDCLGPEKRCVPVIAIVVKITISQVKMSMSQVQHVS